MTPPPELNCPYCTAKMQLGTRTANKIFRNVELNAYKHYFYECKNEKCAHPTCWTTSVSDAISVQNFHKANPKFKKWIAEPNQSQPPPSL